MKPLTLALDIRPAVQKVQTGVQRIIWDYIQELSMMKGVSLLLTGLVARNYDPWILQQLDKRGLTSQVELKLLYLPAILERHLVHVWSDMGYPHLEDLIGHFDVLISFDGRVLPTKQYTVGMIFDAGVWSHSQWYQPGQIDLQDKRLLDINTHANEIWTLSETMQSELRQVKHDVKLPISVVYPSMPQAMNAKSETTNLARKLLVVGRNEPRKNLAIVVSAMKLPQAAPLKLKVDMVGVGTDQLSSPLPRLRTFDYLDDDALWKSHDYLGVIIPTLYEGFGLVPLDALRANLPVILSDIPIHHEVMGQVGCYFDSQEPESLLKSITRLINLSSVERAKLVKAQQDRLRQVLEKHTIRLSVQALSQSLSRRT